jgi:hypothetical protein
MDSHSLTYDEFKIKNMKFVNLTEEKLKEKWDNIGKKVCSCNHNIKCHKCGGDGWCNNCVAYGSSNPHSMCTNWFYLDYENDC